MLPENNFAFIFICLIICGFILLYPTLGLVEAQSLLKTNNLSNNGGLDRSIIFILLLILLLLVLFIFEPIPISLAALLVPIILTIFAQYSRLTTAEALAGFGNPAAITVMAMFVFSAGIQRSGAVQLLGNKISHLTAGQPRHQVALIAVLTGFLSGFINNTPVVAALIPMSKELAQKNNLSPSKLLMPLSYAAILGGTVTLIGTSTNLLASDVSERLLDHPFSLFEFSLLGIIILVIGIIYILTIGYDLIPARLEVEEDLTDQFELQDYLTEVIISKNCDFIDKTITEINTEKEFDYEILRVIRDNEQQEFIEAQSNLRIQAEDHLIIKARREVLLKLVKNKGLKTLPEMILNDQTIEYSLTGENLIEVVIPINSFLVNKTLAEINFVDRYQCSILALRRGEELTHQQLLYYRFQPGDLILLLATSRTADRLQKNSNFIVNQKYNPQLFDKKKMIISISILLFFIAAVALNILPVAIAALLGAFLMAFSGCIDKNDFFAAIDWEVYFLLAGLIPLGTAIEKSGTALFLAQKINYLASFLDPIFTLMLIYLLTSFLTNLISNNASVLLMLPIAVKTAIQVGVNPFAFVITTTFAASAAFASPVGYQTNLMVYSSGRFKFRDFIIAGTPLQLIFTLVVPILVKLIWGF
ncbi:SLC13 family permease [Halanaerobium salsuginis]|uniref:TrkA-C domain-containing protein n=1 Tax=Halanaerobium salsuginis TaxID=29563 RepID=A0A1I4KW28_9FIRM|nr:SLC13 family permease [Halanaerobium salsuginis]SFL82826.1 TrkA-C domain-containing protein [Halanaerobium salsuginis]